MSDGHSDRWREQVRETPSIKDASGRACHLNDEIWAAGTDLSLFRANIVEIDLEQGLLLVMTKSNSMVEIPFKLKNSTPTCNHIIRTY